jgi:hypothetical protein
VDSDIGGLVGRIERAVGHGPHVVGRGDIGILEDTWNAVLAIAEKHTLDR